MPRPVTGRRPDSLFDNRYRYDYIYPRGRSGETLRAYDTLDNDRPVVIKRPAIQDAPPIRAGQEVSILAEKRALEALTGHPVLCELLNSGTFRVGGQTHQYIVMEMAQGETLESMLLAVTARGAKLPELEMLNILDGLLDLLQMAHRKHIIYNDVDAKHLFWDREHYLLKMIDWGNASFIDEHSNGHHSVSPASDLYQTGQLLYFLLSGGQRMDTNRPDPASDLDETISPKLKAIINRACHLETAQRYQDVSSFRSDLAEVRRPVVRGREATLERVRSGLTNATSQEQFETLRQTLDTALATDPGYPPTRELFAEIQLRLKQLAIQADLDAVKIYIESGNTSRAIALIEELIVRMEGGESPLLQYLLDICEVLGTGANPTIPEGLSPALTALLNDDAQAAGRILVTTREIRPQAKVQQALLAERLTRRMPGVVLLRPHLLRLEDMLIRLPDTARALSVVRSLIAKLDEPVPSGMRNLGRIYQRTADILVGLESDLAEISGRSAFEPGESPADVALRARQAADDIVELMDVIGETALTDVARAGNALWRAAAIDPANPAFEAVNSLLNSLHADLEDLRAYTPAVDGTTIHEFLASAHTHLERYDAEIGDPAFRNAVQGIEMATELWGRAIDNLTLGGRKPAADACRAAAEAIKPINPATAAWFTDYARRIEESPNAEALSPNASVGKALGEGWDAWDHGKSADALAAAKRASAAAQSEAEKLASRRLIALAEILEKWIEREGPTSIAQSEAAQRRILGLLLPEEEGIRQKFATQMPNMQIYLRAMGRGVVEPMREASAAAVRILFFDYVLRGMIAVQKEDFEDAGNWREAATRAFQNARVHPAFQLLENAILRRQLILDAVKALNDTTSVSALPQLKQALHAPLASAQLDLADQSVRSLEDALRRWTDGDFRAAHGFLNAAIERAAAAQAALGKDLSAYAAWLQDLADSAEILAQSRRIIDQAALLPADTPDPEVSDAHDKLVDITRRDLGDGYTAQLRQWRDTYRAVRDAYLDPKLSREERVRQIESHFAQLFIDRQPAYSIYKHWREVARMMPDPAPAGASSAQAAAEKDEAAAAGVTFEADAVEAQPIQRAEGRAGGRGGRRIPPLVLIGILVVFVVGAILIALSAGRGSGTTTVVVTNTESATTVASAPTATVKTVTRTPTLPTETPEVIATPTRTAAPPTATPTITSTKPTDTPEAIVPTPTRPIPTGALVGPGTLSPLSSPTSDQPPTLSAGPLPGATLATASVALPTLLPDAATGEYDVLERLPDLATGRGTWDAEWFGRRGDIWQVGSKTLRAGSAPIIRLGPEVLTPLFGANASQYIKRIELEMELDIYDPSLLPGGRVLFGIGLEGFPSGRRASIEAQLIQKNIVALRQNENGTILKRVQVPVTTEKLKVKLAIARGEDRRLTLSYNDQQLGQTGTDWTAGRPLNILIYTSTGGIVVNITAFTVELEPTPR